MTPPTAGPFQYRQLFLASPVPMWVLDDASHRFLAVNLACEQLYHHTREEFLALSLHDICALEEHPRLHLHLHLTTPTPQRWTHRRKDGSTLIVDTHVQPVEFRSHPAQLTVIQDVTQRLHHEESLRLSEERFKLIATATSDAIWDWTPDTNQLWWSDTFYTLFGYERTDFANTFDAWSRCIHPQDADRVVKSLLAARDHPSQTHWTEEYRFQKKDGTYAYVIDRGALIRAPSGHTLRAVGGMADITTQKHLQTQYLRAQRMESIGTLAGGIAHDLNNMLAPIIMSIEILKLQNPAPSAQKLLSTIETSAQRGADLVRQVLSFARGLEGNRVAVHLKHLLKDVLRMLNETFPRNITCKIEFPPDLWVISADPTHLNQVLINLAVNARDAMPQGGNLTFLARNEQVDLTLGTQRQLTPGPYVVIEASDQGIGIPPENLERIFEPFFTTKPVGQGTGLGLSTSHTIIKDHGGQITVYSEPDRGSSFHLYLPADPELQPPSLPARDPELPRGTGQTILLIDDEPAIIAVTRQTLENFGYLVLSAQDGAEGVALYAQHRATIAAVLTDMVMPILDGPATIVALRRINPHLIILAASGHNANGHLAKSSLLGIKHFIAKPYTTETLLKTLRQALT